MPWDLKFKEFLNRIYLVFVFHSGLPESSKQRRIMCFLQNLDRVNGLFSANFLRGHGNQSEVDEMS